MNDLDWWFVGALLGPLSIMLAVYAYGLRCESRCTSRGSRKSAAHD